MRVINKSKSIKSKSIKSLTVDNRTLVASKAASFCVVLSHANPVFRSEESGFKAADSWAEKLPTCCYSKKMIGCR
jgi:hypothetical protein